MTHTVTQVAATQTYTAATDSISTASGLVDVCGPFVYTIDEGYPFVSIDPTTGVITVVSTNMAEISLYTGTFSASLLNYPLVPPASITF
jgi:hypothetical protein